MVGGGHCAENAARNAKLRGGLALVRMEAGTEGLWKAAVLTPQRFRQRGWWVPRVAGVFQRARHTVTQHNACCDGSVREAFGAPLRSGASFVLSQPRMAPIGRRTLSRVHQKLAQQTNH